MMLLCKLVTKPGQRVSGAADSYYVTQSPAGYGLYTYGLAPRTFKTLPALAHTLGGGVNWDRWSDESQQMLEHLKLRGAFC